MTLVRFVYPGSLALKPIGSGRYREFHPAALERFDETGIWAPLGSYVVRFVVDCAGRAAPVAATMGEGPLGTREATNDHTPGDGCHSRR